MDPRLRAQKQRASSALTLQSICPSRSASHVEISRLARYYFALVSKAPGLHCVVLAPGSWSCWEQSAGIAIPLPRPDLMFPWHSLLLGSLSTSAQQCTLQCGCALGSLAKVILFLPAHAMTTVPHPDVVIKKEDDYKRMQQS